MAEEQHKKGPISWMARNRVTANLIMIFFLASGIMLATQIKQEIFPESTMDYVTVSLNYPGASPEEVERGLILATEEAIRGLEGIKEVTATASEGSGSVTAEVLSSYDPNKILQDVRSAVDRIRTFPVEMENYTVSLMSREREVVSIIIWGDQSERALRDLAESIRADLLEYPEITIVNLSGTRTPEISIEVPTEKLRAYNLTLNEIASKIDETVMEMPAGKVKTDSGEIMLRTSDRRYWAREYNDIPIITQDDGTVVRLSDIAKIKETFEESDVRTYFNGKRAVQLGVYRVGDQTPMEVSARVKEHVAEIAGTLPSDTHVDILDDHSEILQYRIDLLFRNAYLGVILVLVLLGLFLEPRLAFWVTLGIPISIIGAILVLPTADISINMISLFAFLITIGVVVDDAVIVGEHVFTMRQRGMSYLKAAIIGAKEMAIPVTFSVLTNIITFSPLLFVPGMMGKIFGSIPIIVTAIYAISLFESLFILPAHLAHKPKKDGIIVRTLNVPRRWMSGILQFIIDRIYTPLLDLTTKWRYTTLAVGIAILILVATMALAGRIDFQFMETVESETASVSITLPIGTPVAETERIKDIVLKAADETIEDYGGPERTKGVMAVIGVPGRGGEGAGSISGGHLANISVFLLPVDERDFSTEEFANSWARRVGVIPGLENITFSFEMMRWGGAPIHVELSHKDNAMLEAAASKLASLLQNYDGIRDIDDGFSEGKTQFDFDIKLTAKSLGLSAADVTNQVRAAFYGAEALRNQRGRDEVKIFVRYPQEERTSLQDIKDLMIRTSGGGEIPLTEATDIKVGNAYTEIRRRNGHRILNVTAEIDRTVTNENKVLSSLESNELEDLTADFNGLTYSFQGRQKEQNESLSGLFAGFGIALLGVYMLLAIPFKSYFQPLIIMFSIPFGCVGAVLGHWIMGYNLSLMSLFGIVALSGVVVNDSLVMIVSANRNREGGDNPHDAIVKAGSGRFRPILLTSLTTFFGLAPMIFETATDAKFLIPMALSLGFGILFATLITLMMVPSLYMILFDIRKLFSWSDEIEEKDEVEEKEVGLVLTE